MNSPQYTWSAFHNNQFTDDRKTFIDDQRATCQHEYVKWDGNPLIMQCAKCGDWHFKS